MVVGLVFSFVIGFGGPKPPVENLPSHTFGCNQSILAQIRPLNEKYDNYYFINFKFLFFKIFFLVVMLGKMLEYNFLMQSLFFLESEAFFS